MYKPTKNYYEARRIHTECGAFEIAAQEASVKRFHEGLNTEGFATVDEAREHLLKLGEAPHALYERGVSAQSMADTWRMLANAPEIDPETSFNLLVDALAIEKHIAVLNSAVKELTKAQKVH